MKKYVVLTILAVFLLSGGIALAASDITGAGYSGTIRATNSDTAAAENVAANVSINTTALINAGLLDSTADNCAVLIGGTDTAFQPGLPGNPWIIYYPSVPANSSSDAELYTGNVTGGKIRYFPDTAGMTTSDDPSFELGDNFTITLPEVWIDTTAGAGKYIWHKDAALELYVDASTSGIINLRVSSGTDTVYIIPNGAGTYSQFHPTGFGTNWQCSETNDGDTSYVSDTDTAYQYDSYNLVNVSDADILASTIYSVRSASLVKNNYGNPAGDASSGIRTHSTNYWPTPTIISGSSWQWKYSTIYTNNPYTSTAWTWDEVNALEAGPEMRGANPYSAIETFTYVTVTYIPATIVSVSGIDSGEYDITISADGTDLTLSVGASSNSTSFAGSVSDNANDIISFENDTVLYAGSQEIEIDGVQKQYVEWEYGTTFTDQSGNGNHATPTFRTTSSDSDVSAVLLDFGPVSTSTVSGDEALTWPTIMEDPPEIPDTMYTENTTPGFFFAGIVHALAVATNIPESLFWYNFAFTFIIGLGVLVYYFLASQKVDKDKALAIKVLVQAGLMCFFALPGLNIYGFFVPLYYLLFSAGILVLSREYGW